ncbi:MAG: hypothetical protein IPM97_08435 [Bdellovibrionaceae bacterium]|nr:hypothetical protein [Pseudobdellovibrionaceae bacterium]
MNKILLFFLMAVVTKVSAVATPSNKMICTEYSTRDRQSNFEYPINNVKISYKKSVLYGDTQIKHYNVQFLGNSRSSFELTDLLYKRTVPYFEGYETSGFKRNVEYQCSRNLLDGRQFHFLVSGGDYGPIMCLSCNEN